MLLPPMIEPQKLTAKRFTGIQTHLEDFRISFVGVTVGAPILPMRLSS